MAARAERRVCGGHRRAPLPVCAQHRVRGLVARHHCEPVHSSGAALPLRAWWKARSALHEVARCCSRLHPTAASDMNAGASLVHLAFSGGRLRRPSRCGGARLRWRRCRPLCWGPSLGPPGPRQPGESALTSPPCYVIQLCEPPHPILMHHQNCRDFSIVCSQFGVSRLQETIAALLAPTLDIISSSPPLQVRTFTIETGHNETSAQKSRLD